MLERTPEPELMDEAEQAAAYAGADFEASHGAIVDALVARLPDFPATGHVLDIGCGPGDISIRVARRFPGVRVDGIDGAEAMLAPGRERIERDGLGERVRLYRVMLPDEAPPRVGYDAVISNSLLHHLHDPMVLWRVVAETTLSGAPVFIADLARPEDEAAVDALVADMAAEPEVLQRDFRASLHAAFTVDEVRGQLRAAGLDLAVGLIDDHHLVVWGYR
ncbi:class I SAM-dependent methyltransferase [Halofilum ochraceum]|uniref:class I SAM-dependent methyltransferase n=1 Tax=Halofilum ochraceum TaxID=1611323 RepID=UPI0008DABDDE|nr:class I SAM-dependent methyltransferase [Halofilum ochraceum]